jgi:methyl-accepting chemotaxis protein
MNFINNLKIGTRLGVAFGLILLLLAAITALGSSAITKTFKATEEVFINSVIPMQSLGQVQYLASRNRILSMNIMLVSDLENVKKRIPDQHAVHDELDKAWKRYVETDTSAREKELIKEFEPALAALRQRALAPIETALLAGNTDDAMKLYREQTQVLSPKLFAILDKLMDIQVELAKEQYDNAGIATSNTSSWLLGAAVLALLLGVLLAWTISRSITRPVGKALAFSRTIAAGDLTAELQDRRRDEIGNLLDALRSMQQSLVQVVSNVRQGSESVATVSAEIAQGNLDLSARTESQASALEQTAASMEELNSTVQQNAENARTANQLAQGASSVASKGGVVVARVVETMKGIEDSSKRISDIISVIDGIAFQTNILALNAAVEAARAGEQGRGFAVVATEVRSLAGRSADAAKEIKALIVTSVERVSQGTVLVNEAGHTMAEVVTSVRRVTDLMGEISAASLEQSAGVAQIGEAVIHMDQATQQNAAMVEEMSAAATGLRNEARELVEVVSVFKLDAMAVAKSAVSSQSTFPPNASHKPMQVRPTTAAARIASRAPRSALSGPRASPSHSQLLSEYGADSWEAF